ncbi:MAG: alpha/beta hydrolase [Bacilli bacterium]|nr:alpha/beta hydrolase [Bacilli bacterium]
MFKFNKKKNVIIATSLLAVASLLIGSKMYFKDSRTIVTQRGEYQSKNVISDNNMTLSLSSLFDKILGIFSGSKLKADKEVTMDSTNVCKFAEATGKSADSYCVKLHANIYHAKKKTHNWALLVHGNNMSAESMANAVGKMYLDNNVNVLAIDLRGFGSSKGSVAMGFLESLDVMNWLDFLNSSSEIDSSRSPEKIVVHGVSLGGATTIQSLTMGGLNVSGLGVMPAISTKKVVGVVDDCGYTSMTGIIASMLPSTSGSSNNISSASHSLFGNGRGFESWGSNNSADNTLGSLGGLKLNGNNDNIANSLIKAVLTGDLFKTGLNSDNFENYQDAFGNNRMADNNVKVMVIHGGKDTMVPPSNADTVINNSNVILQYRPDDSPHAFIIAGQHKDEYTAKVNSFLGELEMKTQDDSSSNSNSGGFFNGIKNFFKNLFK